MENEAEYRLNEVRALIEEGNKEEARMCLLNILKDEPKNIAGLLLLGGSYFEENNFREAKLVFQQLIKINPGTGLYSIALFNALWRLEEMDEALEEIKRFMMHADIETEKETVAQYLSTLNALKENKQIDPAMEPGN